jgi:hypothetical protein
MSVPVYWREAPYRYSLIGNKCKKCCKVYYPPRKVCRVCGSKELEEVKLSERGKVVTFTVIHTPPVGYEKYAPYVVGVVELENGVRVLSQIVDCKPEDIAIGTDVEATFRRVTEDGESGLILYGIKFRPIIK